MFIDAGHSVFSLGEFTNPDAPPTKFRLAHPEFFIPGMWANFNETGCVFNAKRVTRKFARQFDVAIVNHYPEWVRDNLDALGDMPIIVRTVGQD
jgi:hypothetical protein